MKAKREHIIIGVSACWLHAGEQGDLYNGRPLLYLERSMGEWLLRYGQGVPMMIPAAGQGVDVAIGAEDFVDVIDGLLIQGGVDMAPQSYGETPQREEWAGDGQRDAYELELIRHCLDRDKPILGICRGHQVLNVALGGTLIQDIPTELGESVVHRDRDRYHENIHEVEIVKGSELYGLYGVERGLVNSVHHQAISRLGRDLVVEARSPGDGVIEAVRLDDEAYAVGVQWHPEFQEPHQGQLLSPTPILDDFFQAIRRRR
jgi:putative glutamine amidotransferase